MPASRILEGSLPERRPKAQIFSGAQPQPKTEQKAGYQGRSPCLLVSVCVIPVFLFFIVNVFFNYGGYAAHLICRKIQSSPKVHPSPPGNYAQEI